MSRQIIPVSWSIPVQVADAEVFQPDGIVHVQKMQQRLPAIKRGPLREGALGAENIIAQGQGKDIAHGRGGAESNGQAGKFFRAAPLIAADQKRNPPAGKLSGKVPHPCGVAFHRIKIAAILPSAIVTVTHVHANHHVGVAPERLHGGPTGGLEFRPRPEVGPDFIRVFPHQIWRSKAPAIDKNDPRRADFLLHFRAVQWGDEMLLQLEEREHFFPKNREAAIQHAIVPGQVIKNRERRRTAPRPGMRSSQLMRRGTG
jgi:hypothetical protein